MTRDELIQWATSRGWQQDRWGHMQKHHPNGGQHRLKLSRIAVRYEVKSQAGWVRLRSGYFSKLAVTPEGTLKGLAL